MSQLLAQRLLIGGAAALGVWWLARAPRPGRRINPTGYMTVNQGSIAGLFDCSKRASGERAPLAHCIDLEDCDAEGNCAQVAPWKCASLLSDNECF